MKTQINEIKRMQQLAGIIKEGFLDNVAASIKGKSEQGKLAQNLLAKMGITKNPAEVFELGSVGGGGSIQNKQNVQSFLQNGGDLNTKIPFSPKFKGSAGSIKKTTYTFDFNKDIPTMSHSAGVIWDIESQKWVENEYARDVKDEDFDVANMAKEQEANPGEFATEATMMTIAQASKIWPQDNGYGQRIKEMVEFMEGKKITKMTPEDVKEFSKGEKPLSPASATPVAESFDQLDEIVNKVLAKLRSTK
jgi:hypothetical protein